MQTETQIRSIEEKINGLLAAHPAHFLVEVESGKGKKKEIWQETVPFEQVKNTKIQIKF